FSSRRRHTRSKRDWSSDVCSSDLGEDAVGHEHPEEDGADECEDRDDDDADDQCQERGYQAGGRDVPCDDADLDAHEDDDDPEPQDHPPGKPHGSVPRGGTTHRKSSPGGYRLTSRLGLSFSSGNVKTITTRPVSRSARTVTLYSK